MALERWLMYDNQTTWLETGYTVDLANRASISDVYPHVMYTSMLMVSGDSIDTQNAYEAYFACAVTLVGMTMLAVLVSNMAVLMANINANERNFREAISGMCDEMRVMKVPIEMRNRVLDYYDYLFQQQPNLIWGTSWMDRHPRYLQREIMKNLHLKTLSRAPVFNGCSEGFLVEISLLMKQRVYMKREFVFKQGDFANNMFFIISGSVLIVENFRLNGRKNSYRLMTKLGEGSSFGELAIFFKEPRNAGVLANTIVTTMSINQSVVNDIVPLFEADQYCIAKNLSQLDGVHGKYKVEWSLSDRRFKKTPVGQLNRAVTLLRKRHHVDAKEDVTTRSNVSMQPDALLERQHSSPQSEDQQFKREVLANFDALTASIQSLTEDVKELRSQVHTTQQAKS